jgi:hypothetical protein
VRWYARRANVEWRSWLGDGRVVEGSVSEGATSDGEDEEVPDRPGMHRSGLIACQYRAAEWRHKKVELAAHRLLQRLDSDQA